MLAQFQFLSNYKIQNTKYFNDNTPKYNTIILNTNIHIFYILLFINKIHKLNHIRRGVKITFFFLPITKKNVIFLRAPYKNKLARLNILSVRYKFLLTFLLDPQSHEVRPQNGNKDFINNLGALNISSSKIKHVKTKIQYTSNSIHNYTFSNFN